MKEILAVLPTRFRHEVGTLLAKYPVEELRFRSGCTISYTLQARENALQTDLVKPEDLDFILARACEYSVHSVQEQIARGFLTMLGGHRIGLCGTVIMEQGVVKTLRRFSSLSIRIAKEHLGISKNILQQIKTATGISHTLILSPPGLGKTTLLRDCIRGISNGDGVVPQRVGVVDERSEIAALHQGISRFKVGRFTDIIEACPKALGLLFLLRSMNPQVLALDEITDPEDISALTQVAGCGVKLLATAHGQGRDDLYLRPMYRQLMDLGLFEKLVLIDANRQYKVEDLR